MGNLCYNIDFELAGALCVLVIYIALSVYYSRHTEVNRKFSRLVLAAFVAEVMDIASAFTISYGGDIPAWVNTVANTIYFASAFFTGYAFLQYIQSYVYPAHTRAKNGVVNKIVLGVFLALLAANMLFGFFFSFGEGGEYIHGTAYIFVYAVPLYYILFSLAVMLRYHGRFKTKQLVSGVIYVFMALVGAVLQMLVFTDVLLSFFTVSIALLIILFSMETPDYQNLMKTLAELNELRDNLQIEVEKQTQKAKRRAERLERLSKEVILTLAKTIDAKDKYTHGHSERVADYSVRIAKRMGLPEQELDKIYYMGMLHDIGKIGVPDAVINKDGRLTDDEYRMIKMHPSIGEGILKNITSIPDIALGAKYHHEKYDGTGYPEGAAGEDIPLTARIIGIADAYDAMTSRRSYRDALPQDVVRGEIVKGRGTQFDPSCADILLEMMDEDKDYLMRDSVPSEG